jgi:putative peptide zinc metalloprotease protein
VFYVYDRSTGHFFVVRAKERFLLAAMDGRRSLGEIASDYERAFGERPDGAALEGFLGGLRQRRLLEGDADAQTLAALRETAREKRRQGEGGGARRWSLADPDAALGRMLPYAGVLFRPPAVVAGAAAILAAEAFVLWNLGPIWKATWAGGPLVWGAFVALCLASTVVHELAHGLAAKVFGGTVDEVGIMWRYGLPHAYCRAGQVLVFHSRWRRVCVALAGPFASLLVLAPFAPLWVLSPAGWVGALCAKVLTLYNGGILLNFVPVLQLDGYLMLAHALDRPELRQDAQAVLRDAWRRVSGGRSAGAELGRLERLALASYACAALFAVAALVGSGVALVTWLASAWLGRTAALGVVALGGLGWSLVRWAVARRRRDVRGGPVAPPATGGQHA